MATETLRRSAQHHKNLTGWPVNSESTQGTSHVGQEFYSVPDRWPRQYREFMGRVAASDAASKEQAGVWYPPIQLRRADFEQMGRECETLEEVMASMNNVADIVAKAGYIPPYQKKYSDFAGYGKGVRESRLMGHDAYYVNAIEKQEPLIKLSNAGRYLDDTPVPIKGNVMTPDMPYFVKGEAQPQYGIAMIENEDGEREGKIVKYVPATYISNAEQVSTNMIVDWDIDGASVGEIDEPATLWSNFVKDLESAGVLKAKQ